MALSFDSGVPFIGFRTFKKRKPEADPGDYFTAYELFTEPCESIGEADVVTSRTTDAYNTHQPVLDIDVPMYAIPSSTPGHHHLYFDVPPIPWAKYTKLLEALAECGIIEENYADVSIRKGYTAVRLPWIMKETSVVVEP